MRFFQLFALILSLYVNSYANEDSVKGEGEDAAALLTDLNAEPTSIVGGVVNVISGDFIDMAVDLTIPGPEPFKVMRSYSSSDASGGLMEHGWQTNHQGKIDFDYKENGKKTQEAEATFTGPFGESWKLEGERKRKEETMRLSIPKKQFSKGLTNTSKGVISAQSHPRNISLLHDFKDKKWSELTFGSGEKMEFKRSPEGKKHFRLSKITKPNGMHFKYNYQNEKIRHLELTNRTNRTIANVWVDYDKLPRDSKRQSWVHFQAPDGRAVNYLFSRAIVSEKYKILTDVARSDGPPVHYDVETNHYKRGLKVEKMARVKRKCLPDGRYLEIDYYSKGKNEVAGQTFKISDYKSKRCNRVKKILEPAGNDATPIVTHSFIYNLPEGPGQIKGAAEYNAYGLKTDYYFTYENRLIDVLKYDSIGLPFTSEKLYWGPPNTRSQINLQSRAFGSASSPSKLFVRKYDYDHAGNLLTDSLYGNITGGCAVPLCIDGNGTPIENGIEAKRKHYTYTNDGLNLVQTMREGELTVEYRYHPGTSLLAAELHWDSQGIYKRAFYEYDFNGQVILQINDDGALFECDSLVGVTERFIERTVRSGSYPEGMPLEIINTCIDLSSGQELLICRKVQEFDLQGRMRKQSVYGSDGAFAYSKAWDYDSFGNLVKVTDPMGHEIIRNYDLNGNCIREEGPLFGYYKEFVYDYMNRLIAVHERHPDGITISQSFQYDLLGNKICSVDGFGNATHHRYDPFGRMVDEEGPGIETLDGTIANHRVHLEYDLLSRITSKRDAYGNCTQKKFTLLGKPYEITYADGTQERFLYNLQGELIETQTATGATTRNILDGRGRLLRVEQYNSDGTLYSVSESRWGRTRLESSIDALGYVTSFEYDPFGRLKRTITETEVKELEYDALGRVIKTTLSDPSGSKGTVQLQTLDVLGRVITERVEDLDGTLFTEARHSYDSLNRKIETVIGESRTTFEYDTRGMLIASTDPEGNKTTYSADYHYFNAFGQRVLKTTMIDPKGSLLVTTYDIRGKKSLVEQFDAMGTPLHSEEFIYDLNGNKLQMKVTPYHNGQQLPKRIYRFTYDGMNRLIDTYQAYGTPDQKCFSTNYNAFGQKESLTKPDGVVITFEHDDFNRMVALRASDGSIDDRYTYDLMNNPLEVLNGVTSAKTLRTFDSCGRVVTETLQTGITTKFDYEYDGAIRTFTLPDRSSVEYAYKAGFLTEAIRKDSMGNALYAHKIDSYDLMGRVIKETLPQGLGAIEKTFSLNGDLTSSLSPYFSEGDAQYDSEGNLLARTLSDGEGSDAQQFSYDLMGQLKTESGQFEHRYEHDSHGNRLSIDGTSYTINILNQIMSDGNNSCTYDLNGNLLTYGAFTCRYDALDRLIHVDKAGESADYLYDELNRCIERKSGLDSLRYFFITQAEVGGCTPSNSITQFQMVGPGKGGAPCQAITIELNGIAHAALSDQSGHIRTLVNLETHSTTTYRYSAFGETKRYGTAASPWTYAGKREDSLTSWIQFGRRYYIPTLGRFLTQDPAGLSASPNLYCYLNNSPLVRYDTYGLFEASINPFTFMREFATEFCYFTSTIVAAPFHAINTVRPYLGEGIYQLSRHLIPLPYIKDIPQAAGCFLRDLSFKDYTPSFKEDHAQWIEGNGIVVPGRIHLSCNGIMNSRQEAENMLGTLEDAYRGEMGYQFYAPSHGFMQDLGECVLQIIGVRTHQVRAYEEGVKGYIDSVGSDGIVTMDNHSRGGITLSRVLPNLSSDQLSHLWINTYGSGNIIEGRGTKYTMNHMSTHDFIPFIGDVFTYTSSLFKTPSYVEFLPAKSMGLEHGFQETYGYSLKQSADLFYKEYLGK